MATTPEELSACVSAVQQAPRQRVMVGFNRRFAPLTQQLIEMLDRNSESRPLSITYRVNAGPVPEDHWVHQHGGRIIGEVCHFVDWCIAVTKSLPVRVSAQRVGEGVNHDVLASVTFADGSVANIQYLMRVQPTLGKEYIEVFSPALHAVLDDFKLLRWQQGGQVKRKTLAAPEKGFKEEIAAFLSCLQSGSAAPIAFDEMIASTQTTFAIVNALQTGTWADVH